VHTASDVYLRHICSLDTSAFSVFKGFDDNCTKLIFLLTYFS